MKVLDFPKFIRKSTAKLQAACSCIVLCLPIFDCGAICVCGANRPLVRAARWTHEEKPAREYSAILDGQSSERQRNRRFSPREKSL